MKSKLKIYTPSRTLTNKEEIEKEIHRISNDVYDVKWDYLARYARECVDPYGEEYIVVTSLCVGTRRGERGKLFFEVQAYEGKLKDAFRVDTTMYRIDKTPFDGNWDIVKDKLMQKSYYEMTEDEKSPIFIMTMWRILPLLKWRDESMHFLLFLQKYQITAKMLPYKRRRHKR